jgi:hypothetical protein
LVVGQASIGVDLELGENLVDRGSKGVVHAGLGERRRRGPDTATEAQVGRGAGNGMQATTE